MLHQLKQKDKDMAYLIVANSGNWDPQCLGVVGSIKHYSEFRSFCDNKERNEDNSVFPSIVVSHHDHDAMHKHIQDNEMSMYFDGVMEEMILYTNDDDSISMYVLISI